MLEATKPPVKARRKRHVGSPLPLELKLADGTVGQVWDCRVIVYKVGMKRHRLALHRFHGAWRISHTKLGVRVATVQGFLYGAAISTARFTIDGN